MSRKRLAWYVAATVFLWSAGVGGVFWLLPTRPGTTLENCERVELGMTLAEVEALLGTGHSTGLHKHLNRDPWAAPPWLVLGDRGLPGRWYVWSGKEVSVFMTIDEHDRVVYAHFVSLDGTRPQMADRLRTRAGL
jgi:hypothetical protein